MTTTISDVRRANRQWFAPENAKFFGDVGYRVLHGKASGKPFLVRETDGWSDMFGGEKRYHWRINELDASLKILSLIEDVFPDLPAVKQWLEEQA